MSTTFNALTAPLLSSPIVQSFAPIYLTGASSDKATPQAWLCCHCIHYDSASNSQNLLAANACSHCDHERCGLCDTIFNDRSNSISVEGLLFHLDEGQKMVKEATGLREQKTGSEWTLGQTGIGAGPVMAAGAAAVFGAVGVARAVMTSC